MRRTDENLSICTVIFVVGLVVSNITASKLFSTGLTLFGSEVVVPCAVFCYAITFLMTDIIGEIWGKAEADRAVFLGFVGQCFAALLLTVVGMVPAVDPGTQSAYSMLLGQNWVFVVASLVAYLASQNCDVRIFHKLRDRLMRANVSRSSRWIWNNVSTMTSQLIDTVLFITIAFGLGFGWLFQPEMRGTLAAMIVGQYAVKFLLAVADTPFFMLMTRTRATRRVDAR